jgi:hypothetical protein
MSRRAPAVAATIAVVAFAVPGCGGGGKVAGGNSRAATTVTGPPPGAPPGATRFGPGGPPSGGSPQPTHGIGARVLRPGELAGFQTQGVLTATGATTFVGDEGLRSGQAKEVARLRRAGFVGGAIEHLGSPAGADGLSVVDRFATPAAARAEVVTQATVSEPGVKQTLRSVSGIPGAREFDDTSAASQGRNVAFAVGPYYYLVGDGWPKGLANPPQRAPLVAAAQRLYTRARR